MDSAIPPLPLPCSCGYRCDLLDLLQLKVHSQPADAGDCHPFAKQHQQAPAATSALLEMGGGRWRTWRRGFPLLLPFRGPPHRLSMPPSHERSRGSIKSRACRHGRASPVPPVSWLQRSCISTAPSGDTLVPR